MTTQTIPIELTRPGPLPVVYATAGDQYSRFVEMRLFENGAPYTPPDGTTCLVGWRPVADSEDGSQPSESASEAADRAEKAAKDAEAVLGQVDNKIDDAVQGVTDEAKQAAKDAAQSAGQAAASAGKVDEALKELDGMLEDGPVMSVNGKTGRVTLTAADVQALGLPAAPKAGQLLVIEAVGEDGSITVGTADSAPGGGLVVSDTYIPVEKRTEGMLYFFLDSEVGT